MQQQTAVVIGASGMIGNLVTQELLKDEAFTKVRVLVRKPIQLDHPKLETVIVNFADLNDYQKKLGTGDCIFSCIGTTQKNVKGDNKLYRSIDHDIPLNAATLGKAAGFHSFSLVSSVGANAASSNFYLRLKGELEDAISTVGFNSLHIFRPSMLLGNRKEFRFAENIFQGVFKTLSVVLLGSFKKYRAIQGETVAAAMVNAAKQEVEGKFIYEYDAMELLTRS